MSTILPYQGNLSTRYKLLSIGALTLMLHACGGSSGGGGDDLGNGLHADLQHCAYLLDVMTAEAINEAGSCAADPDVPADDPPRNLDLADVAGSDFYPDPNNTAILSGAVIGGGSVDNSLITRSVPFEVGDVAPEISVEHVYAARSRTDETSLITVLRNVSDRPQCLVETAGVAVIDQQNDRILDITNHADVEGTNYRYSNNYISHSCMDSGQLAYVFKAFDITLAEVKGYSIEEVTVADTDYDDGDRVLERIVPVSYEVFPSGEVEVLIANQGTNSVALTTGYTMLLDNDGFPLAFEPAFSSGYLTPEAVLEPGAEVVMSVGFNRIGFGDFEGTATSIRTIVGINSVD